MSGEIDTKPLQRALAEQAPQPAAETILLMSYMSRLSELGQRIQALAERVGRIEDRVSRQLDEFRDEIRDRTQPIPTANSNGKSPATWPAFLASRFWQVVGVVVAVALWILAAFGLRELIEVFGLGGKPP